MVRTDPQETIGEGIGDILSDEAVVGASRTEVGTLDTRLGVEIGFEETFFSDRDDCVKERNRLCFKIILGCEFDGWVGGIEML